MLFPVSCVCWPTPADALAGVLRWQSRLWQLVTKLRAARQLGDVPNPRLLKKKELAEAKKIWENKNYAIQEVTALQPKGLYTQSASWWWVGPDVSKQEREETEVLGSSNSH